MPPKQASYLSKCTTQCLQTYCQRINLLHLQVITWYFSYWSALYKYDGTTSDLDLDPSWSWWSSFKSRWAARNVIQKRTRGVEGENCNQASYQSVAPGWQRKRLEDLWVTLVSPKILQRPQHSLHPQNQGGLGLGTWELQMLSNDTLKVRSGHKDFMNSGSQLSEL